MREHGPVTDRDDAIASWAASSDEPGDGEVRKPRAPPTPPRRPPRRAAAAPPDSAATARHAPPDPSVLAHSGSIIARCNVAAGTAVAVAFDYDDGAAYPFRGDVVRVLGTSARVRFVESHDIAFNQLLRIIGSYEP